MVESVELKRTIIVMRLGITFVYNHLDDLQSTSLTSQFLSIYVKTLSLHEVVADRKLKFPFDKSR